MQYFYKVWLYENGERAVDYSPFLTMPIFIEDRLDDRLDSGEIILDGIDRKKAFDPKTKFIIEMFDGAPGEGDLPKKYWHFIVDRDDVEKYIGATQKYCHRITLIEPSAIAQGKHPDNLSLTYELNDVNMNYKTVVSSDVPTEVKVQRVPTTGGRYYRGPRTTDYWNTLNTTSVIGGNGGGWNRHSRTYENSVTPYTTLFHNTQRLYVDNAFSYTFEGASNFTQQIKYKNGLAVQQYSFTVPKIRCLMQGPNGPEFLFYIPTITRVYRETWDINSDGSVSFASRDTTPIATLQFNPTGVASTKREVFYNESGRVGFYKNRTASGTSSSNHPNPGMQQGHSDTLTRFNSGDWAKCPAIINTNDTSHTNTTISFQTPIYQMSDLQSHEYHYVIETTANPYEANSMIAWISMWDSHSNFRNGSAIVWGLFGYNDDKIDWSTNNSITLVNQMPFISTECIIRDMTLPTVGQTFSVKGAKYNCYQLFRKAMLACDTYLVDNDVEGLDEFMMDANGNIVENPSIDYPIVIHSGDGGENWELRMKNATINETIFEGKNLWEIFLQIGYYLHAVPFMEFLEDGTDRFVLKFRQLGGTSEQDDNSGKITVFNSLPLQDYFASFDAYLTNLYSPQNEVNEMVVAKTSDATTQLISADSAEVRLKYGITELTKFNIKYNGTWKNALEFVFEKSVYDVISNNDPNYVIPSKGSALYYELGDSRIQGLNYVAPQVNNGDNLTALKYVIQRLFGGNQEALDVNSLIFEVGYRTQDSARYTQYRPDLDKFMKNSRVEKYPQHEQYYGQQDKIIDSERFSQNLWGKLIRVGNGVYQCQEYASNGSEKASGDLVRLEEDDESVYYVTEIENEYYDDGIFQKVTYSKNFNQISQIVTIPSEPRFYEVSERSKIRREVRFQEFFKLTRDPDMPVVMPKYLLNAGWQAYVASLIFDAKPTFPNYVASTFKADKRRIHTDSGGNLQNVNDMFPSSDVEVTSNNTVQPVASSPSVTVCVPCLRFHVRNGIVFEWDMEDNFKAGDFVDAPYNTQTGVKDNAYMSMQAARYCDILGRADLFDFVMWYNANFSDGEVKALPKFDAGFDYSRNSNNLVIAKQSEDGRDIALDKDNREALSFNLQLNLLHDREFVVFANIFGEKGNNLSIALCNRVVSMFDEKIDFAWTVLDVPVNKTVDSSVAGRIGISFTLPNNTINDLIDGETLGDAIKSIVFYDNNDSGRIVYFAVNVDKLPPGEKLDPLYIYPKGDFGG